MVAPFYRMKEKARVMLVDHNKEFDTEMVELLKSCEFKVMMVGKASTAMTMLSKEKEKVDVMIINVHSPDQLSFHLLSQAVALDIVSLFVCDEHNELLANKALKDGAYLFLKRPLDEGIVKYLWQFVYREKHQKEKANEGSEIGNTNVGDEEQAGEKNLPNTMEQSNNIHGVENDVVSNEKYKLRRKRDRKSIKETNEGEIQSSANKVVRQRLCTKWTVDLHAKFVEVVHVKEDVTRKTFLR
ncbi:two-component response regulator ORR21-like [Lycium barbarum]|uniref:two-component response regulator ORR21-like n=1 Tax=Lycium barbarum TaxID=112863 RepID=UPI00293F1160|nr:two-component response regulator ORR21-like [Lycium barbarum]